MANSQARPVILEVHDGEIELCNCINKLSQERRIPFFVIELVMNKVLASVREAAQSEFNIAKQQEKESEADGILNT